jgi:hypothetical protein
MESFFPCLLLSPVRTRTLTKRNQAKRRSLRSTASRTKHREGRTPPKIGGTEIASAAFSTTRGE